MKNTQNRMNEMNANGIDTSKYFSIQLSTDMLNGKKVVLSTNRNDLIVEQIASEIEKGGYVNNGHLFRRWVCAQMLRINAQLEYPNRYDWNRSGKYECFDAYIRETFNMRRLLRTIANEVHAIAKIQHDGDVETFHERTTFFNASAISRMYYSLVSEIEYEASKAKMHIQNRYNYGKKREYYKLGTEEIYVADFYDDIDRLRTMIAYLAKKNNYSQVDELVSSINGILGKKAYNRIKVTAPKAFCEAYKGAGAYYTLQNLVLFHEADVENYETKEILHGVEAWEYVQSYLCRDTYKLFALMQEVIHDNEITLSNLVTR